MQLELSDLLEALSHACEALVGLCIAAGVAETTGRLLMGGFRSLRSMRDVWLRFAAWIMLALELALVADIVATATAPSWDAIGQLAAIAAIRTALNFFTERDVREAVAREQAGAGGGPEAPT